MTRRWLHFVLEICMLKDKHAIVYKIVARLCFSEQKAWGISYIWTCLQQALARRSVRCHPRTTAEQARFNCFCSKHPLQGKACSSLLVGCDGCMMRDACEHHVRRGLYDHIRYTITYCCHLCVRYFASAGVNSIKATEQKICCWLLENGHTPADFPCSAAWARNRKSRCDLPSVNE